MHQPLPELQLWGTYITEEFFQIKQWLNKYQVKLNNFLLAYIVSVGLQAYLADSNKLINC